MSDQTIRITKDRMQYLEYLEKNASTIVNNAVLEIIECEKHETHKKRKKSKQTRVTASSTLYMSSIAYLEES